MLFQMSNYVINNSYNIVINMSELLNRDHPEVSAVLEVLHDEEALDQILASTRMKVLYLMASIIGPQLKTDGPYFTATLNAMRDGGCDALIVQTAMSGNTPSLPHYRGASHLVEECRLQNIPAFLVRDSSTPLRKLDHETILEQRGAIILENAFFGENDRVVKIVHGALNSSQNVQVVRTAVHAYFEQTQFPPKGWMSQPEMIVRI